MVYLPFKFGELAPKQPILKEKVKDVVFAPAFLAYISMDVIQFCKHVINEHVLCSNPRTVIRFDHFAPIIPVSSWHNRPGDMRDLIAFGAGAAAKRDSHYDNDGDYTNLFTVPTQVPRIPIKGTVERRLGMAQQAMHRLQLDGDSGPYSRDEHGAAYFCASPDDFILAACSRFLQDVANGQWPTLFTATREHTLHDDPKFVVTANMLTSIDNNASEVRFVEGLTIPTSHKVRRIVYAEMMHRTMYSNRPLYDVKLQSVDQYSIWLLLAVAFMKQDGGLQSEFFQSLGAPTALIAQAMQLLNTGRIDDIAAEVWTMAFEAAKMAPGQRKPLLAWPNVYAALSYQFAEINEFARTLLAAKPSFWQVQKNERKNNA